MIRFLVINSTPQQQIHDAAGEAYIDPTQRAHNVLVGVGPQRSSVSDEVANIVLTTRNDDGESTAIWSRPPLGAEAILFGVEHGVVMEQFRGVVTRVQLSNAATIEVTA